MLGGRAGEASLRGGDMPCPRDSRTATQLRLVVLLPPCTYVRELGMVGEGIDRLSRRKTTCNVVICAAMSVKAGECGVRNVYLGSRRKCRRSQYKLLHNHYDDYVLCRWLLMYTLVIMTDCQLAHTSEDARSLIGSCSFHGMTMRSDI
jgi:hypothetical protein